jgi:pimeloyl-ACP methyl ester carboxylesterase
MEQRLQFESPNGPIDAVYGNAGEGSPLVVIANGHNGFFSYGMFPYIRQSLRESGVSSIGFNYSHSGIVGDSDRFEDLEKYGKNCRRLEKEDLLFVLEQTTRPEFHSHSGVVVLAHSMGGIATVFAAREAANRGIVLKGLILLCCLSTLNVRSQEVMDNWKRNGVWILRNNRTQQDLPQGKEYLEETLASNGEWNLEPVVRSLKLPVLVAHSGHDESVPLRHGESLHGWCRDNNPNSEFFIIPNGSHTLNTKHPFEGPTPQLEAFLANAKRWIAAQ